MPAISRSKKAIYVHIPKTAGTAITMQFYQRGWIDPVDWERWYRNNDHKSAIFIRDAIDEQRLYGDLRWSDFHTFTVVRNPFDRAISFWNYKKRSKGQVHHKEALALSFPEFVQHMHGVFPGDFPDQATWVLDEHGGVMLDQVIKLEDLNGAWLALCDHLGVTGTPLKEINRTHGPFYDHDAYYDETSRALIEDMYARDLELFDYEYVPEQKKDARVTAPVVQFCPTIGSYCGIGTYTEMLCDATGQPAVKELSDLDGAGIDVLHVQHEYGIIPDALFEDVVRYCSANDVRLFVTLHRVERTSLVTLPLIFVDTLRRKLILRRAHRRLLQSREAQASSNGGAAGASASGASARRDSAPSPASRPSSQAAGAGGGARSLHPHHGETRVRKLRRLARGYAANAARLLHAFTYRRRYQRRIVEASDGIVVHAPDARAELVRQGAGNVQVMAHPLKELPTSPRLHSESDGKLHVGYFGFLSPAKDLTSLIQACQKVPDVVLHLLASVPQTQGDISGYARTFIEVAERYDWIDLDIEFLPLADVVLRLSQNDVNVYLTSKLSHGFSSSGSVRQYLAAKRPILANPSPLISDLQDVITVLPDNRPDTIAAAIRSFDPDTSKIEAYVPKHTWDAVPNVYGITV